MENFYVTFDGTDRDQPKVGLSYAIEAADSGSANPVTVGVLVGLAILVLVLILAATCAVVRIIRKKRLEEAKRYFKALEEQNHDDPEPEEDEANAKLKKEDPNSFIKVAENEEEGVTEEG